MEGHLIQVNHGDGATLRGMDKWLGMKEQLGFEMLTSVEQGVSRLMPSWNSKSSKKKEKMSLKRSQTPGVLLGQWLEASVTG